MSIVEATLGPPDPDRVPSVGRRVLTRMLEARAVWLRMPMHLLAIHATSKVVRSLAARRQEPEPGA
jgi:hypothetical protein